MNIRPLVVAASLLACAVAAPLVHAQSDPWSALHAHVADASPLSQRAAAFLAEHRPARDADIDSHILINTVELAVAAREEFAWASAVPEEVFLNDVLPYAVLDETRENWRPAMLERCRPIVAGSTTASEAAQALNRELFNLINVHYNTGRKQPNQSPAESIAQGRATCTGLSIILVDACRSVGIPARITGVASWHDKRGNHTWVEIWDNGWHFLGADEYDPKGLNRGWFVGDASKAIAGSEEHAVWATSFAPTGRHFPMVWARDDTSVHAVDVTGRYAPDASEREAGAGAKLFVRAFDTRGGERIVVSVQAAGTDTAVETRAGTADLNDMPSLSIEPGSAATLIVSREGRARALHVPASDESSRTIEVVWDELGLGRAEAEDQVGRAFERRSEALRAEARARLDAGEITRGDHTLRLLENTFGQAPDSGHSLWISMHGGGGAPAEVNDQQWRNQIRLYELDEGIYVAPRAPTDTWNLWHQEHIDGLFDELIETMIVARGVDPDRVYLMGYSAGGDGVFQLAPRMADRFAAAAMMAGHPNETQPLGLRNLPFAVLMGGDDAAYDRNAKAREWQAALGELRDADPEGYPHEVRIYEGLGHWMERRDAEILPWMAGQSRDAWPKRVVWHQDDVTHDRLYWLAVEPGAATPRSTIIAHAQDQTISITAPAELGSIRLRLRDELIDLDRPIAVDVNGMRCFEGVVPRTEAAIERSLEERLDARSAATAEVVIRFGQ